MAINLSDFPKLIRGGGCELRYIPATPENAQMVFDAIDGARAFLRQWLGFVGMIKSHDDALQWMKSHVENPWVNQKKFWLGIFQDGHFVGCISVFDFEPDPVASAQIGYWMVQSATGHGIMADALHTIELELFERGFNRLEIQVDAGNIPSMHVAERGGYHLDGVLRAASYTQAVGVCDLYVYSKLKTEYKKDVTE
mgnify:CR=1 FL=1